MTNATHHRKPHPEVTRIAMRAFEEDFAMARVLQRAGLNDSTWHRLRREVKNPRASTIAVLDKALDELVAERDRQ